MRRSCFVRWCRLAGSSALFGKHPCHLSYCESSPANRHLSCHCPWLISRASAPERGHGDWHWRLVPASRHARVGSKKLRIPRLAMSSSHRETACDNAHKDAGTSRSLGCEARNGGNNDGAGNPCNIPCNHGGLAWSTYPRPSPSPRSISLSESRCSESRWPRLERIHPSPSHYQAPFVHYQGTTKPPLAITKPLPSPL